MFFKKLIDIISELIFCALKIDTRIFLSALISCCSLLTLSQKRRGIMFIFSFVVMIMIYVLLCLKLRKKRGKKMAAVVSANENQKEYNEFKSCRMDLGKNCGIRLCLTRHHMYVNFGKVSIKKN